MAIHNDWDWYECECGWRMAHYIRPNSAALATWNRKVADHVDAHQTGIPLPPYTPEMAALEDEMRINAA